MTTRATNDETLTNQDPEMTEEQQAEARSQLEDRVRGSLSEVFGDEDGPDDAPSDEEKPEGGEESPEDGEESPEDDEEESPENQDEGEEEDPEDGSDADAGDEDAAEEAAAEGQNDPDAPTLPDAYRRSLKAYGWKDEEIDQNLKALGTNFVSTASRIHENRNAELANFAAAGRQARERQQVPLDQDGQQDQQQTAQEKSPLKALKPVNADQLKEKYGEDELVDAIVGPVNATVEAINAIIPSLQAGQQAAQQAEVERVSRQVDEFFGNEELKSYSELYGSSQEGLNEAQLETRNKVLDTAYDLITGAATLRNQQLSLNEALGLAHEIVSKDFKETAVRQEVKKKAKKRNRGLSMKPTKGSGRNALDRKGEPRDRSELESRTRSRLKSVFG
jgi:hypothetical protein